MLISKVVKTALDKPILICMYGYPGAGKSYVARNLAETVQIAHLSADRLRSNLFANPRFTVQENSIVFHLMNYMASEFLNAGTSVVYDADMFKSSQRRALRELARKHKADYLLAWLQMDPETAFMRTQKRDRRTLDDKVAQPMDQEKFEAIVKSMENPQAEDSMVMSGKHAFPTQKNAVINRLFKMGVINGLGVQQSVAKPELVNLIPNPMQPYDEIADDFSYRNIAIK